MKSKLFITLVAMAFAGLAFGQQAAGTTVQAGNTQNQNATTTETRHNTNADMLKNEATKGNTAVTPAPERHNTNADLVKKEAEASKTNATTTPAPARHNTNADPQ